MRVFVQPYILTALRKAYYHTTHISSEVSQYVNCFLYII